MAQNLVAEHFRKKYFDLIFHFKVDQNLVANLQSTMKEILTWFSTLKAAQNLVADHYEIDFDIIFHITAAQNMVAVHYERDFGHYFLL